MREEEEEEKEKEGREGRKEKEEERRARKAAERGQRRGGYIGATCTDRMDSGGYRRSLFCPPRRAESSVGDDPSAVGFLPKVGSCCSFI